MWPFGPLLFKNWKYKVVHRNDTFRIELKSFDVSKLKMHTFFT